MIRVRIRVRIMAGFRARVRARGRDRLRARVRVRCGGGKCFHMWGGRSTEMCTLPDSLVLTSKQEFLLPREQKDKVH